MPSSRSRCSRRSGPTRRQRAEAPLAETAAASGWVWALPIVRFGAAAASLGALLALIAGIGRTTLAMAREDDLPRYLAAVHPRYRVPHRAEIAIAIVVIAAVATVDLRGAAVVLVGIAGRLVVLKLRQLRSL